MNYCPDCGQPIESHHETCIDCLFAGAADAKPNTGAELLKALEENGFIGAARTEEETDPDEQPYDADAMILVRAGDWQQLEQERESARDLVLSIAGWLNLEEGFGPSVIQRQVDRIYAAAKWLRTGEELLCRTLDTQMQRMDEETMDEIEARAMAWGEGAQALVDIPALISALRAARAVAREYYRDLQGETSEYLWQKHYAGDAEVYPWLKEIDEPQEAKEPAAG